MPLCYGAVDIQTSRRLVPVICTPLFLEDFLGAVYKSSWGCCVGAVSGGWWQDGMRNGEVLRFLTMLEGYTNDSIAVGFLAPGTGAAAPPELSSQSVQSTCLDYSRGESRTSNLYCRNGQLRGSLTLSSPTPHIQSNELINAEHLGLPSWPCLTNATTVVGTIGA